jgi:transposase
MREADAKRPKAGLVFALPVPALALPRFRFYGFDLSRRFRQHPMANDQHRPPRRIGQGTRESVSVAHDMSGKFPTLWGFGMRRTEGLQGVRMIKFLSSLSRYEAAEFSQLEAAELLGVGERTFRRWRQRFEDAGDAGLLDRRLGKASGKRVPVDREAEVEALYRSRYAGFTAKHFHEHLARDHQFAWGYTWTKTFLQSKGYWRRRRSAAHTGASGRAGRCLA